MPFSAILQKNCCNLYLKPSIWFEKIHRLYIFSGASKTHYRIDLFNPTIDCSSTIVYIVHALCIFSFIHFFRENRLHLVLGACRLNRCSILHEYMVKIVSIWICNLAPFGRYIHWLESCMKGYQWFFYADFQFCYARIFSSVNGSYREQWRPMPEHCVCQLPSFSLPYST